MSIPFHSRSAAKGVKKVGRDKTYRQGTLPTLVRGKVGRSGVVYWYGSNPDLLKVGKDLGLDVRNFNILFGDTSQLIGARALVIASMPSMNQRVIRHVCHAVNYGIVCVWVHPHIDPGTWAWNFKFCYVGDVDPLAFWGRVCTVLR